MSNDFNPPPMREPMFNKDRMSPAWLRWFHQLKEHLGATGSIAWAVIDKTGSSLADLTTRLFTDLQFTGSNLTSIATRLFTDLQFTGSNLTSLATRRHRDLQDLQGGTTDEYYHFTSAQHTESTGFFAATDITGAQAETLTDGSVADSLHIHRAYADDILLTSADALVTDGNGNLLIGSP